MNSDLEQTLRTIDRVPVRIKMTQIIRQTRQRTVEILEIKRTRVQTRKKIPKNAT